MSDLAPFVAAALRDKVVSDLQAENERLQEQLNAYRRIQIVTGSHGHFEVDEEDSDDEDAKPLVVHAQGQLEEGSILSSNRNLFELKLEGKQPCPLPELRNARIMVGGYHKTHITPDDFMAYLYENDEYDSDNSKFVSLWGSQCWVMLVIHGWPREHWSEVLQAAEDDIMDQHAILPILLRGLPRRFPHATVQFLEISLLSRMNHGAIDNLPSGMLSRMRSELDKQLSRKKFTGYIRQQYRKLGNQEDPERFYQHCLEIAKVLVRKCKIDCATDQTKPTIRKLVIIHNNTCRTSTTGSFNFFEMADQLIAVGVSKSKVIKSIAARC
ncbi:expressed unknown protein [Seminavis robusta]|uniref:Uncharacterized protein n=1 Tax=Seminavis robusta TaxID=568900 RepID=A0A9N8HG25_9STRA|nr:expressed unknown protein [Seminavis robusta]|eukprot:Sro553_g165350.1 n/a (326) ;mRNA; r:36142-37119